MTPETKVKAKIKKWLAKHATWWTSISDRFHVGIPDFLCILEVNKFYGTLTAIEAKSDTGKLTLRQLEEARRIKEAGGVYWVASPGSSLLFGEPVPFEISEVNTERGFT